MNYNYTLKYRTFDSLLEDVKIDFRNFSLESRIEPAQLVKVVQRVSYDLGMRVLMTKEVILDIEKGKARLPETFFSLNFAMICGKYSITRIPPQGTHIEEVVPEYRDFIEPTTCEGEYDPCDPPLSTTPPCLTKCGTEYKLIHKVNSETREYKVMHPIRFRNSEFVDCDCPNTKLRCANEAYIKDGFIFTNLDHGQIYMNYQSHLEDEEGNLLVVDHPFVNEYYEYALKDRILENLAMDGENVSNQFSLVAQRLRGARANALSYVNTPNFAEMAKLWAANRKAQYGRYYDMFKSYSTPTYLDINNNI